MRSKLKGGLFSPGISQHLKNSGSLCSFVSLRVPSSFSCHCLFPHLGRATRESRTEVTRVPVETDTLSSEVGVPPHRPRSVESATPGSFRVGRLGAQGSYFPTLQGDAEAKFRRHKAEFRTTIHPKGRGIEASWSPSWHP